MEQVKRKDYRDFFKVSRDHYKKVTGIYASACLRLLLDEDKPLTTKQIAGELGLSQSTVTTVITSRLVKEELVTYERYGSVTLTGKGVEKAMEHHRHHRLLEVFLVEELGMPVAEACEEAERLMHAISCKTINLICEKYNHPRSGVLQRTIHHPRTCQCHSH